MTGTAPAARELIPTRTPSSTKESKRRRNSLLSEKESCHTDNQISKSLTTKVFGEKNEDFLCVCFRLGDDKMGDELLL